MNLAKTKLTDNPQSHYNNIYKLIKISFDEQLVSDTTFCLLLCNPRTYKIAFNLEENTISKLKENIDIEVNTIFINDSSIDSILSTVCNDIKQKYNICISDIAIDKLFKANKKYNINLVQKIFKFGRSNRSFCEISIFKC